MTVNQRFVADDLIAVIKARSMLIILLATCKETLTALEAAGTVLDVGLADDLRRMIARSEAELEAITKRVAPEGTQAKDD